MAASQPEPMDFGVLMGLFYNAYIDELIRGLAKSGFDDLGLLYGAVFRVVSEGDVGLRELADRLAMTSNGALKIVKEMEKRGYVRRVGDDTDGRVRLIQLTERGKAAGRAARRLHRRLERDLKKQYGMGRVDAARALFEARISEDVDEHYQHPPLRRVV